MEVKLFFTQTCPYCTESVNFVKENDLNVKLMDATNDIEIKKELIEIGDMMQVPMLSVDGEANYEVSEILKWLKDHKEELMKK